jgi:hypothetical protein
MPNSSIEDLRARQGEQFDPVGFHLLERMAARAQAQGGRVGQRLTERTRTLVQAFEQRMAQEAGQRVVQQIKPSTELPSTQQRDSLAALVQQLQVQDAHAFDAPHAQRGAKPAHSTPELKAVKNFRATWSKLSVDQAIKKAALQAPLNAGPINSHMVAIKSLALMRDMAPDYLHRFMTYLDALTALEPGDKPAKDSKPVKRTSSAQLTRK